MSTPNRESHGDDLGILAGIKAEDLMSRDILTLSENQPLKDAARMLLENGIQGAPVIADDGEVSGVLSVTDLARHEREREADVVDESAYYHLREVSKNLELPWQQGYHLETMDEPLVKDVMTPSVISVKEETGIREVLQTLIRFRIHRVMVISPAKHTVVGVITETDIIRALLAALEGKTEP